MKFLTNSLIAACFLTYGALFGVLTENEELLFKAIKNNDITTFNELFTSKDKITSLCQNFMFMLQNNAHAKRNLVGPVVNNVDINLVDTNSGVTFFELALRYNRDAMLDTLIERGLLKRKENQDFLFKNDYISSKYVYLAIEYENQKTLKKLLDCGVNIELSYIGSEYRPLLQAINQYLNGSMLNDLTIIKMLLCNNAQYNYNMKYADDKNPLKLVTTSNSADLKSLFQQIVIYQYDKTISALNAVITDNDSILSPREWLMLALHKKNYNQIWYCIKQKTIELEYVLALILLNKRLPVDFVNNLFLDKLTDKLTHKLYRKAQEQDHKKLGKALATIKRIKHDLTLKNRGNAHGKLPKEIVNNILSYL